MCVTTIRMWDKVSDYLLSAKYDPLTIGGGEVGFADNDGSDSSTAVSGSVVRSELPSKKVLPRKRKATSAA